jgi:hypothetical protein
LKAAATGPENLTAKYAEYAKSFSEMRSGISRGSQSSCLGAQGKSGEIREKSNAEPPDAGHEFHELTRIF